MGLPIRLHGVPLGALLALPFLLAMFSREVFFDAGEVAESSRGVMVDACGFGAQVDLASGFFCGLLLELPRQVVSSSVEL